MNQTKEQFYKDLGARLKTLRKADYVTQMQIAAVCGVSYQQYQKYENGKNPISCFTLMVLCTHYKIDIKALLQ